MEENAEGNGSLGPDLKEGGRNPAARAAAGGWSSAPVRVGERRRSGREKTEPEAGSPRPLYTQDTRPGGRTARQR